MVSVCSSCEESNINETSNQKESGSLSYIISTDLKFTKFREILRISKLDELYSRNDEVLTLFVPLDQSLGDPYNSLLKNMDLLTARNIIKACTLKDRIPTDILSDSPYSQLMTANSTNNVTITTLDNKIMINTKFNIIEADIIASNGIIHIIDGLIVPEMN